MKTRVSIRTRAFMKARVFFIKIRAFCLGRTRSDSTGQIEARTGAIESTSCSIVSERGLFRSGVSAEPETSALIWLPYFGHPFSPGTLPYSSESTESVLRPAFAFHTPFLRSLSRLPLPLPRLLWHLLRISTLGMSVNAFPLPPNLRLVSAWPIQYKPAWSESDLP